MDIFGTQVTSSNITIFLGLAGTFGLGLITLYWRLKIFWYDREQEFLRHVDSVMKEHNASQTAQLEQCIHSIPGHPESTQEKGGN